MIEVGKEVICIDDSGFNRPILKKGSIYNVNAIKSNCDGVIVVDVGILNTYSDNSPLPFGAKYTCCVCNRIHISDGKHWFRISRFAPIEEQDISELTEVLEKEAFEI